MLEVDWMSAKFARALFHTQLIRKVALDSNKLVLQSDVAVGRDLCRHALFSFRRQTREEASYEN
jgi:hypothetical protein